MRVEVFVELPDIESIETSGNIIVIWLSIFSGIVLSVINVQVILPFSSVPEIIAKPTSSVSKPAGTVITGVFG